MFKSISIFEFDDNGVVFLDTGSDFLKFGPVWSIFLVYRASFVAVNPYILISDVVFLDTWFGNVN